MLEAQEKGFWPEPEGRELRVALGQGPKTHPGLERSRTCAIGRFDPRTEPMGTDLKRAHDHADETGNPMAPVDYDFDDLDEPTGVDELESTIETLESELEELKSEVGSLREEVADCRRNNGAGWAVVTMIVLWWFFSRSHW